MTGIEMLWLGRKLSAAGYTPIRFPYSSLRQTPAENAEKLFRFTQERSFEKVHYVAHSLGGIVLHHMFSAHQDLPPGRIVMMGTPAQGNNVARKVAGKSWLRLLLGRSVEKGVLGNVPLWQSTFELGVISGIGDGLGVGRLLGVVEGENDGTVAVEETRIDNATANCSLKTGHMSMLFSSCVAENVIRFLDTGGFVNSSRKLSGT